MSVQLHPRVVVLGRSLSSFHICGITGLALGTSLALTLAGHAGLSRAVVVMLLASGVCTFLALAMATKVVTRRESLVYYHHEVAILSVSAGLLALLQLPVLPYLDVTALGLGLILVCGRCGCLLVGCCYGKPCRWGIRYGHEHAVEGFPDCYVGARLFPVQPLEASIVAAIVLAASLMVVRGWQAGAAVSSYVVTYAAARIWLEELRGDGDRPYWLRLSEAQWTSLVLMLSVVASEWAGRLPFSPWHIGALAVAVLSLMAVAARRSGAAAVVQARHAGEIATIVCDLPDSSSAAVVVRRTSLTVGVSRQALGPPDASGGAVLFSLSRADRKLTFGEARAVGGLILNLMSSGEPAPKMFRGGSSVFHLIVRAC